MSHPNVNDEQQFIYSGSGKRKATPEEVQRVRELECESNGHSFDAVMTFGSLDPKQFLCPNCGKSWAVVPVIRHREQPDDQLQEGSTLR